MSDNLRWLTSDKTILVASIPEYWTWKQLMRWMKFLNRILDTCEQPITLMVDFQYSTYMPKQVASKVPDVLNNLHPKVDFIMFVRMSPTQRAVLSIILKVHRNIAPKVSIIEDVDDIMSLV